MLMTWALLRGIGLEVCDWISTASKTSFYFRLHTILLPIILIM